MSTRYYPHYVKGSPQLRVFLSNFWMKLVNQPERPRPPNEVVFITSLEMTKYDIKDYLEKIYKIPVIEVRTEIKMGEIKKRKDKGYIIKDDDYRIAYVTMPKDCKFEFPDIFAKQSEAKEEEKNQVTLLENEYKRMKYGNKDRPGIPGWFGL